MMSRLKVLSYMFIVILASCATKKNMENVDNKLLQHKWELMVLDDKNIDTKQPIYLEFIDGDKVGGYLGCNRVTGTYTMLPANKLKFSQLATTRMYCPEMNLETQLLDLLNKAEYFEILNGKLILKNDKKNTLATFNKMSDNTIVNKYWKLVKLDGRAVKMADNQAREQYFTLRSDNTVNGFAGCNQFNGTYKLESGSRIKFNENMAVTMMACPDVKVNEADFLNVFQLVDNYTIKEDVLSLNVGKRAPLAVFEAVYFD